MKTSRSFASCAPRLHPVLAAGLLAVLSAPFAAAATLPFVPDATGAAAPLFDPDSGTLLSPATGGDVTVGDFEQLTINTTTGVITKDGTGAFSGTGDVGITEDGGNGSKEIALFTFNNLLISKGARVKITGNRAVGLMARNIIAIDEMIYVSGAQNIAADLPPGGFPGGASVTVVGTSSPGLPGGGIPGFEGTAGGGGGRQHTDARLTDLPGGSGGGSGTVSVILPFLSGSSGGGGAGGGALLLLAQQALVLGNNSTILATGGQGGDGTSPTFDDPAGGGGGGAGGAVVLCSPSVVLNSGVQLNLAGGAFGRGRVSDFFNSAYNGTAGETGRLAIYSKTIVNGGATITATRFDNPAADYPAALAVPASGGGYVQYLNDNSAVPTPLFDPDNATLLSPATSGDVTVLAGETLNINTSMGYISKAGTDSFISIGDTGNTASGTDGSKQIALFTFRNLTVNAGASVIITGAKSAGFLARNNLTIHGTVNVSGSSEYPVRPGPGGFTGGPSVNTTSSGFPGGGMTGYAGTAGTTVASAGGGRTYWDTRLTDLLGGSGGGSGGAVQGAIAATSGEGGHGGGGLLLLAQNSITVGPTGVLLAKGGAGENGDAIPGLAGAGGGGGGAGGAVVLCAPGIALNIGSQINLAGGAGGQGVDMPSGTAGENGRLAIYSKTFPVAAGAVITGTRFDNILAAYPDALTLAGEAPPVMISFTMEKANQSGGYIATIIGKGTPGARYDFQRSSDLLTWTQDGSSRTAGTDGLMTVIRTANTATQGKLYWRFKKL